MCYYFSTSYSDFKKIERFEKRHIVKDKKKDMGNGTAEEFINL
jgi:hypothetical protein